MSRHNRAARFVNLSGSDSLILFNGERLCLFVCSLISQGISKRIPLRTHANSMDSNKETLLSQDVAVSLLQENKMALKRCELVRVWPSFSCY